MKQSATLDSSFWINAYRAGLLPYVLARFRLFYAPAVAGEIKLEFASGRQFWTLVAEGVLSEAVPRRRRFIEYRPGEQAAINVALEHRDWVLLIDDRRPFTAAARLGILAMCTPMFVVQMLTEGAMKTERASELLGRLGGLGTVSPELLTAAFDQIEEIQTRGRSSTNGH